MDVQNWFSPIPIRSADTADASAAAVTRGDCSQAASTDNWITRRFRCKLYYREVSRTCGPVTGGRRRQTATDRTGRHMTVGDRWHLVWNITYSEFAGSNDGVVSSLLSPTPTHKVSDVGFSTTACWSLRFLLNTFSRLHLCRRYMLTGCCLQYAYRKRNSASDQ